MDWQLSAEEKYDCLKAIQSYKQLVYSLQLQFTVGLPSRRLAIQLSHARERRAFTSQPTQWASELQSILLLQL